MMEDAASLTVMIVFCGLATSVARIIAGAHPRPSALRLVLVLGFSVIAIIALLVISRGLNAPQIPTTTIMCSIGLVAVVVIEDAVVLGMKRKSFTPVAVES